MTGTAEAIVRAPARRGRPEGATGAETRARLVEAAAKCFARHGYAHVNLAEIAAEADITGPAIYNYYPSKEALFVAAIEAVYEEIAQAFRDAVRFDGSWHERLDAILRAASDIYRADGFYHGIANVAQTQLMRKPDVFHPILDARQGVTKIFQHIVGDAVSAGEFPEDTNVAVTGELLMAFVMNGMSSVTEVRSSQADFDETVIAFRLLMQMKR